MTKQTMTTLTWAGAALVGGPLTLGSALADSGNPFLAQPLSSAHIQLAQAEGKCGEGKCGGQEGTEAKCGADKESEGKCGGGDKGAEGKGEGKCGEGKCGGGN
ncbi:hypothetical protein Thiowin_02433 [Thiorhodovibrio winogradskyi]|uniref:Low-complexity protein n=1 Tax=Thiorhodovibrio winogradskyi TaxID=77007 RepID=A0ABZ0SAG0_9GAMM|nr:low-complexity protein [Thiorhodovibrio winogradskyi]